MKKKLLPLLLALAVCLSLMPVGVSAAQTGLPDWYFLFAIFKNVDADVTDKDGQTTHIKYTMSQDEIDYAKKEAEDFEAAMNSFGVMCAHVDVVEIDSPVTDVLSNDAYGPASRLKPLQAASLLKDKATLNQYDFVFCIVDLNVNTGYTGRTNGEYENGTGHSCINFWNWNRWTPDQVPGGLYVHEFLHFMECVSARYGKEYDLHKIGDFYGTADCLSDVMQNRAKGEHGAGVAPEAWQYPPHVFRTTYEWPIPSNVTCIGRWAFYNCVALTKITIPSNITSIGGAAFRECTNLSEVTILPGATSIGNQAFWECTALTKISIPASITSIGYAAFYKAGIKDVYYEGTEAQWKAIEIGEYNEALTNANIHYQSKAAAEPQKPVQTAPAVSFTDVKSSDWFAKPVAWAVEKGITSGTSEATFSPNKTCTHGQIITFLWRAAGSPDPSAAVALKGVEPDVYYYKALQWAVAAEITADGPFYPDAACTRGDTVTYLWKLAGSPSAKAASFADVPSSAACAQAVSWAVEQGVTGGTSETTFSPDKTCTRGQIVTFLYAALA